MTRIRFVVMDTMSKSPQVAAPTTRHESAHDLPHGQAAPVNPMTGQPLPSPATVSVSVENGTDTYDQASDTGAALGVLGFHVVGVGDATPTGDGSETVVYYGSLVPSAEAAAEAVAHMMTGSVIMAYDPSQVTDGAQVTVVTGSQFAVDAPAPPAPSGAGSSTPTTSGSSSSAATPSSSAIAAPSSDNPALAPWDPKGCEPGAVPTAPVPNLP